MSSSQTPAMNETVRRRHLSYRLSPALALFILAVLVGGAIGLCFWAAERVFPQIGPLAAVAYGALLAVTYLATLACSVHARRWLVIIRQSRQVLRRRRRVRHLIEFLEEV